MEPLNRTEVPDGYEVRHGWLRKLNSAHTFVCRNISNPCWCEDNAWRVDLNCRMVVLSSVGILVYAHDLYQRCGCMHCSMFYNGI